MAAVAVGVILAVALMASTVIYRGALRQLGLQTDLNRVSDQELDVRVLNSAHGLARGLADESFATIDRRLRIPRDYISETVHSLTSATFFMTELGAIPPEQDPRDRARVLYFEGVEEKVRDCSGDEEVPEVPDQFLVAAFKVVDDLFRVKKELEEHKSRAEQKSRGLVEILDKSLTKVDNLQGKFTGSGAKQA